MTDPKDQQILECPSCYGTISNVSDLQTNKKYKCGNCGKLFFLIENVFNKIKS